MRLKVRQGGFQQVDRVLQGSGIECKARTGSCKKLRQRHAAAQCNRSAIPGQRKHFVFRGIAPDLHGAQLRETVFNVIKRHLKNMQLAVPVTDADAST